MLGLREDTLVILTGDHAETLYEHECWFDHHGLYENTLPVPLIMRLPGRLPRRPLVSRIHLPAPGSRADGPEAAGNPGAGDAGSTAPRCCP